MQQKTQLTLHEMQEREAKMLEYLHRICVENNIKYYLYGGTLIGAVRHQGFIPWDDDLDVLVPRKDYKRLLSILHSHKEYRLLSHEYQDDYYYPFAKLTDPETKLIEYGVKECKELGVWLDIFPLDSVSNNPLIRLLHAKIVMKLVGMNQYVAADETCILQEIDSFPKKIKFVIAKQFKSQTLIRFIHTLAGIYVDKETAYKADLLWSSNYKYFFPANWFGDPKILKFEGGNYYVPTDYDSFLKVLYGDYMKLPPEEKRHSDHFYSCYKIEK